jgi:4-hydroxy-tetrahydrodipicolinate reductase
MWLSKLSRYNERRVVIVPNFTLGVNLMLRILKDACKVYKNAEIIELHHDKKIDAPSGTAIHTSHLISQNMKPDIPPGAKDESRGKFVENIPVHAIRLPGLLAHQEVIFGGPGEVFTIRHDTTDRDAFLNGIYLAIENLEKLEPGLTVGLDWVF